MNRQEIKNLKDTLYKYILLQNNLELFTTPNSKTKSKHLDFITIDTQIEILQGNLKQFINSKLFQIKVHNTYIKKNKTNGVD